MVARIPNLELLLYKAQQALAHDPDFVQKIAEIKENDSHKKVYLDFSVECFSRGLTALLVVNGRNGSRRTRYDFSIMVSRWRTLLCWNVSRLVLPRAQSRYLPSKLRTPT